jgi:YHS domain-containing protein
MKKSISIFIVAVIIISGGYILAVNFLIKGSDDPIVSEAKLQTELVCMVNDAYMGIKQFPVPVEDKMYYGCCEQCVDKIKNVRQFRYAKDPLTGEEVDKASAFIVMKSEIDHSVYYFKSQDNYLKFHKEQK